MDSRRSSTEDTNEIVWSTFKRIVLFIWDVIVVVSTLPSIFFVTFQAFYNAGIQWQWIIIYIADIVYIVSIVVTFFRSFMKKGVKITSKKEIALHYIRTSFLPDIVSILPLELFCFAASNVLYAATLLRLNRCIRCYKPWAFLSSRENQPGTRTMLLMTLRFTYLASLCAHIVAGVWFSVACYSVQSDAAYQLGAICKPNTWSVDSTTKHGISWNTASEFEKYIISLYWSVTTISSVGYGDIVPVTSLEKWIATACMILGVVLFGYILGGLASLLTNADAQRSRYIHRLNTIRDNLDETKTSPFLKKKVTEYYEYLWRRNKGNAVTDLFDELPLVLQAELSLESYKSMIGKSTLFKDAPEEFMRMLSLVVKHTLYLPQQVILNKGDMGHHMYFVQTGVVEILPDENAPPVAVFKEGDIFGERNLVYSVPTCALVRARTHCDILKLSKTDVQQVLQHFPEISDKMKAEIKRRCDTAFSPVEEQGSVTSLISLGVDSCFRLRHDNGEQSCFGKIKKWWMSHPVMPGATFTIAWDIVVVVVTIIISLVYSYLAAFTHFKPSVSYTAGPVVGSAMLALTYLLDLVLVVDIVVSTKRAVQTPTEVIIDQKTAFLSYIKSLGFYLDVLSVLPLEVFALLWLPSGEQIRYVAVFRINRLLKLWKVMKFFHQIESSLYISISQAMVIKFTVYIVTATHLSSCLWFISACFYQESCTSGSWATSNSISPTTTPLHDYLISIYWAAATTTTVGYGDVRAHNVSEMILALVVQMVGVLLYGYFLGAIAAALTNVASSRVSFQEKIQVVHQFMFDHKLSPGLITRVDHYFTLLWGQYKGETVPGGESLMHDMPRSVCEDVSMEECSTLLNNIPVFKLADHNFLRQVSLAMSTYVFAPGDIVLYNGDMGKEMYCVQRGYVEILAEDLSQVVKVLGPGSYFGELGFLFGGVPRTATVRAATHCKLMMLNRIDVDTILQNFPLIEKQFRELAADKEHFRITQEAIVEASTRAMRNPRVFTKPCTTTALAVAMATPLSVIVRSSLAATIAACVGCRDYQSKLSSPISIGETFEGTVIKYDRKEYNRLLYADQESTSPKSTVRQRERRQNQVITLSSISVVEEEVEEEEHREPGCPQRCAGCFEKIFSFFLLPYTVIPTTRFGQVWESLGFVFALVSVITVSIQAAFLHREAAFWAINYLLDIFFYADMILKLHTAYYTNEGVLITQPITCALHYIRTNFFLDIISSFPIDIIVLMAWSSNIQDVLRVLSLSRLNRLIRIYKLPIAFNFLDNQISRSTEIITQLKFAVYMTVCTHWAACGWFLVACSSFFIGASDSHVCSVGSWAHHLETTTNHSGLPYQYVVSLYWAAATTTTVGYGDISARTDLERIYAIFIMIVGVLAYGYIIASVAAGLTNADSGRAQYQEKLNAVKSYMSDQGLDSSITKRVTNYYEYIWQRNKGVSFSSLFQGIPKSLQADISLSLYKNILDQVPLFQNTEIGFTKLLALSIQPALFLRNEYIVRKGDIGSEMFFINRGTVDVVSEDGTVVFASMGEGQFFGEISLVFSCPRTASIRAGTNCDVLVLTKLDLDNALQYYPHIADHIQEVANNRANLVMKRSQISKMAAAEGSGAVKKAAKGTKDKEVEPSVGSAGESTTSHGEISVEEVEEEEAEPPQPSCMVTFCKPLLKTLLVFILPGDGLFGTIFHLLGCILSYCSFFTISYQAAFQSNELALWIINYMFQAYFLVEIFLKFHVSYKDSNSNTVSDLKSIALRYLKDPRGFLLDFAAILPYELIGAFIPNPSTRLVAVLYLRTPHIMRVIRIQWFFSAEEKKLNQRTLLLRVLKFIALITLCTHFVACVWFVLGCPAGTCQPNTWAGATSMDLAADKYCNSLYWAVTTMTTTGYGDFLATNALEMIYASMVMVIGKLLFGFILGSIVSTLANLDTQRVLYGEKLTALKDYMKEQHLSSVMHRRVLGFFDYLWARNKGVDQRTLLSDMPHCMQAEVSLAITEFLLKTEPLFADADDAFLRHLALIIKPCIFLPGEFIVHKGDVGLGMFLLFHGQVEVMDETDPDQVKEVLTEGGSFGQESLLYNIPMESSVRAITHLEIFTIGQADFEHVLNDHQNMKNMINEVAQRVYSKPIDLGNTR